MLFLLCPSLRFQTSLSLFLPPQARHSSGRPSSPGFWDLLRYDNATDGHIYCRPTPRNLTTLQPKGDAVEGQVPSSLNEDELEEDAAAWAKAEVFGRYLTAVRTNVEQSTMESVLQAWEG